MTNEVATRKMFDSVLKFIIFCVRSAALTSILWPLEFGLQGDNALSEFIVSYV